MSDRVAWLEARSRGAPPALRQRVMAYLDRAGGDGELAADLAEAGRLALRAALEQGDRRSAAFDLLAADALVTLALQAQADGHPGALRTFAGQLW
ncbi:MAG TPA: hypothetical protein VLL51_03920, partial [Gemmatimonadales bacterium]|nr:hypothetical protein [Gemmatimonadales bacterium]